MSTAREEDVIGNWLKLALPITTHMIHVLTRCHFVYIQSYKHNNNANTNHIRGRCALFMYRLPLLFLLSLSFSCYSQELDSVMIKNLVHEIENNRGLDSANHNWSEMTGVYPDGGFEFVTWYNGEELVKVYLQVGLSYGRLTTIIYLDDSKPIMTIETEENFNLNNEGEIDLSRLNLVFREVTFLYKEDPAGSGEYDLEYRTMGKRVFSDPYCSSSELLYPLTLIR